MILNSDNNSFLILHDNKLLIKNMNEYNRMKYEDFDGNRIIIKIGKAEIIETFNNGIFNVIYDNFSMQVRNSNEVCKLIRANNDQFILDLLKNENQDQFNLEFLLLSLKDYPGIKISKDDIIINDVFSIDKNGQAYFYYKDKKSRLCIVAHDIKTIKYQTDLGVININFRTLEILHKVLFLLNPNLNDSVFYNQLPQEIKDLLK